MESIAMTAMNFIQPMRSLIIRVNICVCALNCFPFNTSRPSLPFAPLTCQPSVSGVFPNNIQGSGGGVSDVIAKGPPERGSQGPSHHVGLGVPHPGAVDFSAAPAPRPCWPPPTADCPSPAAGWGSAGRRGCVSAGPGGEPRASPAPSGSRHCGSHCGPGSADCRRPPGWPPSARLPHLERLTNEPATHSRSARLPSWLWR